MTTIDEQPCPGAPTRAAPAVSDPGGARRRRTAVGIDPRVPAASATPHAPSRFTFPLVERLIGANTASRSLGFRGAPGAHRGLDLALDKE